MNKKRGLPISDLSKENLKGIKLIVFDVDGVLVRRGTKIKQIGNVTTLETKRIAVKQIEQIKKLNSRGYLININSGRGLYMLQEMFSEVLGFVSLTYENGSATWYKGRVYQHVNSFDKLKKVRGELAKVSSKEIKGWEPKEFIITIHCKGRVGKIESVVSRFKDLYSIWNDEAYDIGIKKVQTKTTGLKEVMKMFKLKNKNVLALGDNYNDKELLNSVGVSVSADKERVEGDFYVPLNGKFLPADVLMGRIL